MRNISNDLIAVHGSTIWLTLTQKAPMGMKQDVFIYSVYHEEMIARLEVSSFENASTSNDQKESEDDEFVEFDDAVKELEKS